jgi:hypothetical protein
MHTDRSRWVQQQAARYKGWGARGEGKGCREWLFMELFCLWRPRVAVMGAVITSAQGMLA